MIIGALTWLEENQYNYKLKFEKPVNPVNKPEEKKAEEPGGFKFPAWFTDSDYKEKQFLSNEEKARSKFKDMFASTLSTTNFEALSSILTKEDIELINVPGTHSLIRKLWSNRLQFKKNQEESQVRRRTSSEQWF